MKTNMKLLALYFLLIVTLFPSFLLGCNPSLGINGIEPVITGNTTTEPYRTLTRTPRMMESPIPSLTPTPPQLPTLEVLAAIEEINRLIQTNGECEYPCFWGITPGVTTWNEALSILQPITESINYVDSPWIGDSFSLNLIASDDNYEMESNIGLVINRGIVTQIFILKEMSIDSILRAFGRPEDVWFYFIEAELWDPGYSVILMYPSTGVSFIFFDEYGAHYSQNENFQYVEVCPEDMHNIEVGFHFWQPTDLQVYADMIIYFSENNNPPYINIGESYEMNLDLFYSTFLLNNSNTCLRISRH